MASKIRGLIGRQYMEHQQRHKGADGQKPGRRLEVEGEAWEFVEQGLRQGVPSTLDLFAPDFFDRTRLDVFRMGRYYIKTLFVTALPREVRVGWLLPFLTQLSDLDLSIHIDPYDEVQALDELTRTITKLKTRQALLRGNIQMVSELQQAEADAWGIRDLIQNNLARLFRVSIAANLYALSEEQLRQEGERLEQRLGGRHIHARWAEGRMDEGYQSVNPLGLNFLRDAYRNLDSWALATVFPFVQADLSHEHGIPLAVNRQTNALVFFDPYDPSLGNHSIVVYAASGAGKSAAIKIMTARMRLAGERTIILDPEGEYRKLVEVLGGTVFVVGDPQYIFNPLDLEVDEDTEDRTPRVDLHEKVLDFSNLVESVIPELTTHDKALLEQAVQAVYAARGITTDPASLRQADGSPKPMPRIRDVYNWLTEHQQSLGTSTQLISGMSRLLAGHTLGFLDGETNVTLKDVPVIVFDISRLEEGEPRTLGLQVILAWVWEKFVKKHPERKKRVVVDEAWQFADHPQTIDFLERMVRRCRKRSAGLTIISQDFIRLAQHPKTRAIHQNSDTFLFMRQNDSDLAALVEAFNLSAGERAYLETCAKGEGILRVGQPHGIVIAVKFQPTEREREWAYTSPLRQRARA